MKTPLELTPSLALVLTAALLLPGCDSDSPAGPGTAAVEISVTVTGGLAGADFTLFVDGEERILQGVRCRSLCDFQDGRILTGLSRAQIDGLVELAREAGLPDTGDRDYGTECCDFFRYEIEYAEGDDRVRISGDGATLPGPLASLAGRIRAMADETLPTVVALDTDRNDWPDDRLIVHSVEVAGGVLEVEATYAGGCEPHSIDLVAFGGFMESDPVRVNAALAHDARGDACEAAIRRDLRFDLDPLYDAYDRSYPPGGPLIIQLQDPGGGTPFSLELTWSGEGG